MSCTICWKCKNAICGCPWSKHFKPVENWIAIPTKIKSSYIDGKQKLVDSFIVVSCPMFKNESNKNIDFVCSKFKISIRTYYRWCSRKIIDVTGKILDTSYVKKFLRDRQTRLEKTNDKR